MAAAAVTGTMRVVNVTDGLEIVEALGFRHAFAPHRHDCYVVGLTAHGIQRFRYRHEARIAVPGDCFVLHPDEVHDGRPGTDQGYGYRAAYVSPKLISDALDGRSLPFVEEVVASTPVLTGVLTELLSLRYCDKDRVEPTDGITQLADVLAALAGSRRPAVLPHRTEMLRIRDHLCAHWCEGVAMATLETEHGIDRFTIARLFRRQFGVSPGRFVVLRKLDHAKELIRTGAGLAETACACGFADQSHMTRHFQRAFGLTPGRWRQLTH